MEFQINEGGTGDVWVINGSGVTVDGQQLYQSTAGPGPRGIGDLTGRTLSK